MNQIGFRPVWRLFILTDGFDVPTTPYSYNDLLTFAGRLLKLSIIVSLIGFDTDDYRHNTASSQPSPADQWGHAGIFVLVVKRG